MGLGLGRPTGCNPNEFKIWPVRMLGGGAVYKPLTFAILRVTVLMDCNLALVWSATMLGGGCNCKMPEIRIANHP